MANRIFIARHGETAWSLSGQHTSVSDIPLTEHGREQASALAPRLAGETFELVLCSPRLRARDTCSLAGYGDLAQLTDDLVEWDYGEYEGLTTPQIHSDRDVDWNLWRDGCPGGESPAQIGARVDAVLARFAAIEGDGLAFAHGHVLRALTARYLEMDVAAGARFKLATAALGVLGHEHDNATLDRWSA